MTVPALKPRRFPAVKSLALAMAFIPLMARAAPAETPRPKLIVAISVDQFSANLFDEWRGRFTGGFARLANGVVYSSGYQTHANTETCPGHSTLLTGKHPNKTGIIANAFRDPATGKTVYCLHDPSVVLAHDAKANPVGPQRLMATTLGDWMKAANPASLVVAVSSKDRAAINMAGHNPDGVFWMIPGSGLTTYMAPGADAEKALRPVADFNRRIAKTWSVRPKWTYTHPECRAAAQTWTIAGKPWESKLPPTGWGESDDPQAIAANAMRSPIADDLTGQAARELIDAYNLGRGPATDLLAVSFSATDYVGHTYGTRGPEMCEQLHRLDATIGKLLTTLDGLKVPYLVVLSADHGGSDFNERLVSQGYPATRVAGRDVLGRVNASLMSELRLAAPPLQGSVDEVILADSVAPGDRQRVLRAAVRTLAAQPEIAAAYTQEDLLATPIPKGASPDEVSVKERFAMSTYLGRSPDISAALHPWSTTLQPGTGAVSTHGSPWTYDRRVPILFWWPGAQPQYRYGAVETTDIAPTLAAAAGVTPPTDIDGHCLPLAGAGGMKCP